MATLEDLVAPRNLLGMVQNFSKEEEESMPIQRLFQEGGTRRFTGNVAEFDREDFSQALAPVTGDDTPSVPVAPKDRKTVRFDMIGVRIHEYVRLKKIMVTGRALGEPMPNAQAEIARKVQSLVRRSTRTREYCCAQHLVNGSGLTVNSTNIPGSTVVLSHDFGTTEFSVGASWATAGTKILSGSAEIAAIKNSMLENHGAPPGRVIFNNTVAGYIFANTEAQGWLQTTAAGVQAVRDRSVASLGGLGGIPQWVEFDHGYKDDIGGSWTKFWTDDIICVLPAMVDGILGFAEGQDVEPGGNVVGSVQEILAAAQLQFGRFIYVTLESDPPAIKIILVDNFVPVIFLPEAVIRSDVTA